MNNLQRRFSSNKYYNIFWVIFLMVAISLVMSSCKGRSQYSDQQDSSVAPFPIDSLKITGPSVKLCDQQLTSFETIVSASCQTGDEDFDYSKEKTPAEDAFFFPELDIENTEIVRNVQLRYNYAAVLNRVVHSFELFLRKSSDDSLATRRDTLGVIAEDMVSLSPSFLQRAIPYDETRRNALGLLASYSRFDGKSHDGSALDLAFEKYNDGFQNLPIIAEDTVMDDFSESFWEWYDKRQYVPEYDQIVSIYLEKGLFGNALTEDEIEHFKAVIEGEPEINRRTVLALELMRIGEDATLYLGEILESGIYTKYLLEAWLAWRSCVQIHYISPSSFAVIPNNYYDKVRVKCMNTILRHIQTNPDKYDVCLLENMLLCQILHRQAAISGNESLAELAAMSKVEFIQPSALGRDYLVESED